MNMRSHLMRLLVLSLLGGAALAERAHAIPERPERRFAQWSGQNWGMVITVPRIARYGDTIQAHATVVGGPAADPWWSCSQYSAWTANGTSGINVSVPGNWEMPSSVIDYFGNRVSIMTREAGDPPPYGWEDRVSDTCYCIVTDFGAQGGCESREYQPLLFHMMDQFNPRAGHVKFAKVTSGNGWVSITGQFEGRAGVGWSDWASDTIYVLGDEADLSEDSDEDGLPDVWEYAHSPNQSLDDFGGSVQRGALTSRCDSAPQRMNRIETDRIARASLPAPSAGAGRSPEQTFTLTTDPPAWVSPYAPRESDWVPVSASDWDGDGVSDKDEYHRWLAGDLDGDGVPYDPTCINTPRRKDDSGCGGGSSPGIWALWLVALRLLGVNRPRRLGRPPLRETLPPRRRPWLWVAASFTAACGSGPDDAASDGADTDITAPDGYVVDVFDPSDGEDDVTEPTDLADGTTDGATGNDGTLVVPPLAELGAIAISDDGPTTLAVLDQFVVEIPAGAASPAATLVLSGASTPYVTLPWNWIAAYDVSLVENGLPVQPTGPLTLRFRVFPALLREAIAPEDQLIAATLNDATADWSELPYRLEVDGSGVTWMMVTTDHLTTFAQFIVGPGQSVFSTPYWRILYDPGIDAVGLGATSIEGLAVAYRAVLDHAHDAYVAAGFADPRLPPTSWTKVTVYILPMVDEGALYNPFTGNVLLNSLIANDAEARYEASHEVFHIFQNAKLNAHSMGNRKWFVEAAAAYAGDALAARNGHLAKLVKPDFLQHGIDTVDSKHEYGLGHFIQWAVSQGLSFKTLQDRVFAAWSTGDEPLVAFGDTIVPAIGGDCPGTTFAQKYLCYARVLLTEPGTPIVGASITQQVANTTGELGANDAVAGGVISTGPWAATVWAGKVRASGGTRKVRLLYAVATGACNIDGFLVAGDSAGNGQRLVRKLYGAQTGFEDIEANDGDTAVIVATTSDQCSLHVELRDAKTCTVTAVAGEVAYECEDSQGTHTIAESPTCLDGGTIGYHSFGCSAAYGPTAHCIDFAVTLPCPAEAPHCFPLSGSLYRMPACLQSPP